MAVVGDFIATARVEGGSNIYNPLIAIAIATATAIATEIQPTICFNFYRHTNKWCIWRLQGNMNAFDIYTFLQQLQLQVIANFAALYHKRWTCTSLLSILLKVSNCNSYPLVISVISTATLTIINATTIGFKDKDIIV
uniref:Uncharacterized protein n=1 Tax=Glossina palpalis gambiensis TaxID=67801 RepID=A0A1B0AR82_9MUSC